MENESATTTQTLYQRRIDGSYLLSQRTIALVHRSNLDVVIPSPIHSHDRQSILVSFSTSPPVHSCRTMCICVKCYDGDNSLNFKPFFYGYNNAKSTQ